MKVWKKASVLVLRLLVIATFVAVAPLAVAVELPTPDFGGETITIMSWFEMIGENNLEGLERLEMAEEKFNCRIEMLPVGWGQLTEMAMTRLLSGDSAYDLWNLYDVHFWPMVAQGAFYPLSEVLSAEYYASIGADVPVLEYMGVRYDMNRFDPGNGLHVIFWNKDMFAREGLPDLYDLYYNDEWTWEAFEEILAQVTKDTTGDGEIDRIGIVNLYDSASHILFSNGTSKLVTTEDGRVRFNYDDPAVIETYSKLQQWVTEDRVALPWGKERFVQGTAAMLYERYGAMGGQMEEDHGMVPFPKGPNATDYVFPGHGATAVLLPANSADPAGMVALYQFLFDYEDEWEREMRREDEIAAVVTDFESFEILLEAHEQWNGELGFYYRALIWDWERGGPKNEVFAGTKTAAVALQEAAPAVQATVDELLRQ